LLLAEAGGMVSDRVLELINFELELGNFELEFELKFPTNNIKSTN